MATCKLCLYCVAVLWITLSSARGQVTSPTILITSPNMLRYNTEETVSISTFGSHEPFDVTISLLDYPDRMNEFSQKIVTVAEGQIGKTGVIVMPGDLPENEQDPQYVVLKATAPGFQEESIILVNPAAGFMFIQTDKPIYTPAQEVKIRVIPLTEDMRPVAWSLQLDVINPLDVSVNRREVTWDGNFIVERFTLPKIPVFGNWSVRAKFNAESTAAASVAFEVREYVLPTFSVTVDTPPYILPDTNESYMVTVNARYVYGKPVAGSCYMSYGLVMDGIYYHLNRTVRQLNEGTAQIPINVDHMRSVDEIARFWFPDGARLHVEAEVKEVPTGNKERSISRATVLANSPYRFNLKKSPRYFKPSMPYMLVIDATTVNGAAAKLLSVRVKAKRTSSDGNFQESWLPLGSATTDDNGKLMISVDTTASENEITFEVHSNDPAFNQDQQAQSPDFVIRPYVSPTASYLSVRHPDNNLLRVGQTTQVEALTQPGLLATGGIHFMVVSRGRVVHHIIRETGDDLTTSVSFQVTKDMVPAARLVAFYMRTDNNEIVADSAWLEVENVCENTELTTDVTDAEGKKPKQRATFHLYGPADALVGLLAVDKAVYFLNNRDILKRSKIFKAMEQHDVGCTFGSGENAAGVFKDAGLAVVTNANIDRSTRRSSIGCEEHRNRRKRSVENFRRLQHPCCSRGLEFASTVSSVTDCKSRSWEVHIKTKSSRCANLFYLCCKEQYYQLHGSEDGPSERGAGGQEDTDTFTFDDIDEEAIPLRENFPESWLFEERHLSDKGELDVQVLIPDSITTWVIQAVGVSSEHGMCIAEPQEVQVFKDFFLQLELPYSAIRMEQMEVRVTVFNYKPKRLKVRVYMRGAKGICYSTVSGRKSDRHNFYVESNNAKTVKFPIVPLEPGEFDITAVAITSHGSDRVLRKLTVVSEGKEEKRAVSFWLDPGRRKRNIVPELGSLTLQTIYHENQGRQLNEVNLVLPEEAIIGSGKAKAAAVANPMDSTVSRAILGVEALMRIPTGCGEQTIIHLAPTVSAMRYLNETQQMTPDIMQKGEALIRQGVQRELIYKKDDGSFAVWQNNPSSTWLTAFVVRTFCQAKAFTFVDDTVICDAVRWLATQQNETGAFYEGYWVHHKSMLGGVNGDVTMTAFVLLSMMECRCRQEGTEQNVEKAMRFIESRLSEVTRPLAVAMSAYALAVADSERKREANDKLKALAKYTPEGYRYWSIADESAFDSHRTPYWYKQQPSALSVETTAYALLTQLEHNDIDYSNQIAEWLLNERSTAGTFVSTQDTVMALQALTDYNIKTYAADIDMHSNLHSSLDTRFRRDIRLFQQDALVEKSVENVPVGGKLIIVTEGSGLGRMSVDMIYNVDISREELCKFDTTIVATQIDLRDIINKQSGPHCDVCGVCDEVGNLNDPYGQDPDYYSYGDEYDTHVLPQNRRQRRNIAEGHGGSLDRICLTVCVRHKDQGGGAVDMGILEVGLPTGFQAYEDDLEKLQNESRIDSYEMSDRSVVLYVQTIPSDHQECFKFTATETFEIGNRQSSILKVYDYYNPTEYCLRFYGVGHSGQIELFCEKDQKDRKLEQVCQCAETQCAECWQKKLPSIQRRMLDRKACLESDYVFRLRVTNVQQEGNFKRVNAILTQDPIKTGIQDRLTEGSELSFWSRITCECPDMKAGVVYFVMGKDGNAYVNENNVRRYRYILDKSSLVLEDKCRGRSDSVNQRNACNVMKQTENAVKRGRCRD